MYSLLRTKRVWQILGGFPPSRFLGAIHLIASSGDILALGCINPSINTSNQLSGLEVPSKIESPTYGDSFSLNRENFPNGRAYHIPVTLPNIQLLRALCQMRSGSIDKDLFFDHAIIYRTGSPVIPLANFHDAFAGGDLYLSGLYEAKELRPFLEALGSSAVLKENSEGVG